MTHPLVEQLERVREAVASRVLGHDAAASDLLAGFIGGGHVLIAGEPGMGKTLLISSLARATSLEFRRIQCTPDLMPADVSGTDIIAEDQATGERAVRFLPGPIFANVVLAAELARATPKAQAALLEPLEEGAITSAGRRHSLPDPFTLVCTVGVGRQDGTYPLSTAALDRFMIGVRMGFPPREDEIRAIDRAATRESEPVDVLLSREDTLAARRRVHEVTVSEEVHRLVSTLVRSLRPGEGRTSLVTEYVRYGPSTRAGGHLIAAARARAFLRDHAAATTDDVRAMAVAVLGHRLVLAFRAEAEGVSTTDIITGALAALLGAGR